MTIQNLIVPINVQALCIGANDAKTGSNFIKPLADFSQLPYRFGNERYNIKANLSDDILAKPLSDDLTTMQFGVHIHWTLPNILTKSKEEAKFPIIPNSWLVVRVVFDNNNQIKSYKTWVVESDFISESADNNQTSVPYEISSVSGKTFRFLGRVRPYEAWNKDTGTYEHYSNLTAISYGNLRFASFYPDCSSVLGFCDNFQDADDKTLRENGAKLGYLVVGWYQDNKDDFLREIDSTKVKNWLASHKWQIAEGKTEEFDPTKASSLCTGFVYNVEWDPKKDYISGSIPDAKVSFASTGVSALSALLANLIDDKQATEDLLNALQIDALSQLDEIGGHDKIEQLLHLHRFNKINGGITWTIKKLSNTHVTSEKTFDINLPQDLIASLSDLNNYQAQLDQVNSVTRAVRWQIFVDWCKYLAKSYSNSPDPKIISSIKTFISNEIDLGLNPLLDTTADLNKRFTSARQLIQNKIDELNKKTPDVQLTLQDTPAFRYFTPSDPVIILSSTDAKGWEYAGERNKSESNFLTCRLSEQIIYKKGVSPKAILDGNRVLFVADLNSLINEMLLLSNLDISKPLDKSIYSGIVPEKFTINDWNGTPWLPLLLEWKVSYQHLKRSSDNTYPSAHMVNNFEFDSSSAELQYKVTPQFDQLEIEPYFGSTILTPSTKKNLITQLNNYLEFLNDEELKKVATDVANISILAQTLDGLNSALLMKKRSIQLAVADPLAGVLSESFVQKVQIAVDKMNITSPLPNVIFNPIIDGICYIEKLRIVDAFGRVKDVNLQDIIYPQNMKKIQIAGNQYVQLFPSIIQPSRLQFQLLPENQSSIENFIEPLLENPIRGWVLPNYFDHSLMFYDANGAPLGSLIAGSEGAVWQSAPGLYDFGTSIDVVFQGKNQDLYDFANNIFNISNSEAGKYYLKDLINNIKTTTEFIQPKGYSQSYVQSLLFGTPLALIKAATRIELQGIPSANEDDDSFNKDINNSRYLLRTNNNFPDVEFMVKLGNHKYFEDGVVGYFASKQNNENIDYSTFYTTSTTTKVDKNIVNDNTITLKPTYFSNSKDENTKQASYFSILVDPRASIHIYSSILPVKAISLPNNMIKKAMDNILVSFFISPIITDDLSNILKLPLSKQSKFLWNWTYANNQDGKTNWVKIIPKDIDPKSIFTNPQKICEGWLQTVVSNQEK